MPKTRPGLRGHAHLLVSDPHPHPRLNLLQSVPVGGEAAPACAFPQRQEESAPVAEASTVVFSLCIQHPAWGPLWNVSVEVPSPSLQPPSVGA